MKIFLQLLHRMHTCTMYMHTYMYYHSQLKPYLYYAT